MSLCDHGVIKSVYFELLGTQQPALVYSTPLSCLYYKLVLRLKDCLQLYNEATWHLQVSATSVFIQFLTLAHLFHSSCRQARGPAQLQRSVRQQLRQHRPLGILHPGPHRPRLHRVLRQGSALFLLRQIKDLLKPEGNFNDKNLAMWRNFTLHF